MSMCSVFSYVVGRGCLLWLVSSLGKTLLAFALLHFVLQGQTYLLLQVSLDFLLLNSSPLWWKWYLFWVLVLEYLVGLHRTVQLQLLQHYWSGHRLGLLWYWMVCLGNRDHSVIFETAHKYCIWGSFVDYKGYAISSKGFLPTVVGIMVIWVKFIHSCPSYFSDSLNVSFSLLPSPVWPRPNCPNIPGSYAILLFTASDLASITSHIHNWVLFLFSLCLFILSGVISPLISSSILGTYWPGEFLFQYPIFLPFHTIHGVLKAGILKWFVIPFSSGPHFVRTLHHDPSVLGGPTRHGW